MKERIASIKQQKQDRRVVVDPRLGFDKARRTKASLRKQAHWTSKNYRPKCLADKVRLKASSIAMAYRSTASQQKSSMRIAISNSLPKSLVPPYIVPDEMDEKEPASGEQRCKVHGTKFVERTVNMRPKMSMEKPLRVSGVKKATKAEDVRILQDPKRQEEDLEMPKKVIPGITRRPRPVKQDVDCQSDTTLILTSLPAPPHDTTSPVPQQVPSLKATSPIAIIPPQSHLSPPLTDGMLPTPPPMLPKRRPPSLFIPRKRPKLS